MKIRADEHVSIEIVLAVRKMALTPGWELTQVTEVGDRGSDDEHWATKFAREGGHAIISGDTDFQRHKQLVLAINRSGLKVIHLPSKWSNARCDLQAAHVLLWWKRIEAQLQSMAARECYRPPWGFSEEAGLTRVGLDYQEADKWEKKRAKKAQKAANDR